MKTPRRLPRRGLSPRAASHDGFRCRWWFVCSSPLLMRGPGELRRRWFFLVPPRASRFGARCRPGRPPSVPPPRGLPVGWLRVCSTRVAWQRGGGGDRARGVPGGGVLAGPPRCPPTTTNGRRDNQGVLHRCFFPHRSSSGGWLHHECLGGTLKTTLRQLPGAGGGQTGAVCAWCSTGARETTHHRAEREREREKGVTWQARKPTELMLLAC